MENKLEEKEKWENKINFIVCNSDKDIIFISKVRMIQLIEDIDKRHQEIDKEPDLTNPKDLLDYKINLLKNMPKKLNVKAYTMIVKGNKTLNQWLEE